MIVQSWSLRVADEKHEKAHFCTFPANCKKSRFSWFSWKMTIFGTFLEKREKPQKGLKSDSRCLNVPVKLPKYLLFSMPPPPLGGGPAYPQKHPPQVAVEPGARNRVGSTFCTKVQNVDTTRCQWSLRGRWSLMNVHRWSLSMQPVSASSATWWGSLSRRVDGDR